MALPEATVTDMQASFAAIKKKNLRFIILPPLSGNSPWVIIGKNAQVSARLKAARKVKGFKKSGFSGRIEVPARSLLFIPDNDGEVATLTAKLPRWHASLKSEDDTTIKKLAALLNKSQVITLSGFESGSYSDDDVEYTDDGGYIAMDEAELKEIFGEDLEDLRGELATMVAVTAKLKLTATEISSQLDAMSDGSELLASIQGVDGKTMPSMVPEFLKFALGAGKDALALQALKAGKDLDNQEQVFSLAAAVSDYMRALMAWRSSQESFFEIDKKIKGLADKSVSTLATVNLAELFSIHRSRIDDTREAEAVVDDKLSELNDQRKSLS